MKNLFLSLSALTFIGSPALVQAATVELDIKTEFHRPLKVKSADVIFLAANPVCQSSRGSYFGMPIITPNIKKIAAKVTKISPEVLRLSFDTDLKGNMDLCDYRFDAASLKLGGAASGNDFFVNIQSNKSRNYPRVNMALNVATASKIAAVCDSSTRRCESYGLAGSVETSYGEVNLVLDQKTARTNRKVKSTLSLEIR